MENKTIKNVEFVINNIKKIINSQIKCSEQLATAGSKSYSQGYIQALNFALQLFDNEIDLVKMLEK